MLKKIITNGLSGFESGIVGSSYLKGLELCGFYSRQHKKQKIDSRGINLFNLVEYDGDVWDTIKKNLKMSDGCLIYDDGSISSSEENKKVEELCDIYDVPRMIIKHYDKDVMSKILSFLSKNKITHLYVCDVGNNNDIKDTHKKFFLLFTDLFGYLK